VKRGTSGTNAQYVLCVAPGSKAARPASQRKLGARSVACGWSGVTSSREPMPLAGSAGSCPGAVAPAPANESESSTTERRARAATRWVHGRARQHRPQPDGEVSDKLGLVSEVGQIRERSLWSERKLAVLTVNAVVLHRAKPRAVLRCLGRYAEHRGHRCLWGGARSVSDCLASLRLSERNGAEAQLVKRTRKWSGAAAKLASQSSCAAEQCGSGELPIWANRVTWREPKPMGCEPHRRSGARQRQARLAQVSAL